MKHGLSGSMLTLLMRVSPVHDVSLMHEVEELQQLLHDNGSVSLAKVMLRITTGGTTSH